MATAAAMRSGWVLRKTSFSPKNNKIPMEKFIRDIMKNTDADKFS